MPPPPAGMHYYKQEIIKDGKPTGTYVSTDTPHAVPPA
jgi:hypothetical protein